MFNIGISRQPEAFLDELVGLLVVVILGILVRRSTRGTAAGGPWRRHNIRAVLPGCSTCEHAVSSNPLQGNSIIPFLLLGGAMRFVV